MSWTKKNVHPGKIVSTSQQVEVVVLDIDMSKRRISLGLKQCTVNPWEDLTQTYPIGTEIEGEIRNITEFGLFVGLTEDIDGLVHLSDISWDTTGEAALEDLKKAKLSKLKFSTSILTKSVFHLELSNNRRSIRWSGGFISQRKL